MPSETNIHSDSETGIEDVSVNNIDELDESSNDDVTDTLDIINVETIETDSDMASMTTQTPVYQNSECEPLDDTWTCSSGSKNLSLCIKFCTIGFDLRYFHKTLIISCILSRQRVLFDA